MSRFTVQRYCAKNDVNGNPRRVFVIRDEAGTIVATADEGYAGRRAAAKALQGLGVESSKNPSYGFHGWEGVTDLGDVDVAPGIYRRMKNYRVTKP